VNHRCKIIATLGPSSLSHKSVQALAASGIDAVRINMSHGDHDSHQEVIKVVRRVSINLGRPIAVILDLQGPKIRTGKLISGKPLKLENKQVVKFLFTRDPGFEGTITTSWKLKVKPRQFIFLDDGDIQLRVMRNIKGGVLCRVLQGGSLSERKGIFIPGASMEEFPSLTRKDVDDLTWGLRLGVDFVALSLVRKAADCREAKRAMRRTGRVVPLIAKIETLSAVKKLGEILPEVEGIMVARGDLALDVGAEHVPLLQKELIHRALAEGKFSITATQMLQSMIIRPSPTRAEASDIANAVLDGSDAVMLSGETAIGKYPVKAVRFMNRIIAATEAGGNFNLQQKVLRDRSTGTIAQALAEAACFAANEVQSKKIVAFTQRGNSVIRLSSLRPKAQIIAICFDRKVQSRLILRWGVDPQLLMAVKSSESLIHRTDKFLRSRGLASKKETVVITAGEISGIPLSNMVKVHRVGG